MIRLDGFSLSLATSPEVSSYLAPQEGRVAGEEGLCGRILRAYSAVLHSLFGTSMFGAAQAPHLLNTACHSQLKSNAVSFPVIPGSNYVPKTQFKSLAKILTNNPNNATTTLMLLSREESLYSPEDATHVYSAQQPV